MIEAGAPTANHMEQIATDMTALLCNLMPTYSGDVAGLASGGLVRRMEAGGRALWDAWGLDALQRAIEFESDIARGWGVMALRCATDLSFADRLALALPYADDPHFAVREWAWLSLRQAVADNPLGAIPHLIPLASARSPRVRRLASEVTRPVSVWGRHIQALKADPDAAVEILEPLRSDDARYVQTSVANWINDASKSRPDWSEALVERWGREAPESASTAWICARALRSLRRHA
jgi:3-methyladenine DNA glycosylase AlkC